MNAAHSLTVPVLQTGDDTGIAVTVWIAPRSVPPLDALSSTGFDVGTVWLFAAVALVTGSVAITVGRRRKTVGRALTHRTAR